jgi:hypothetical protein
MSWHIDSHKTAISNRTAAALGLKSAEKNDEIWQKRDEIWWLFWWLFVSNFYAFWCNALQA